MQNDEFSSRRQRSFELKRNSRLRPLRRLASNDTILRGRSPTTDLFNNDISVRNKLTGTDVLRCKLTSDVSKAANDVNSARSPYKNIELTTVRSPGLKTAKATIRTQLSSGKYSYQSSRDTADCCVIDDDDSETDDSVDQSRDQRELGGRSTEEARGCIAEDPKVLSNDEFRGPSNENTRGRSTLTPLGHSADCLSLHNGKSVIKRN